MKKFIVLAACLITIHISLSAHFSVKPNPNSVILAERNLAEGVDFLSFVEKSVWLLDKAAKTNSRIILEKFASKNASEEDWMQLSKNLGFSSKAALLVYVNSIQASLIKVRDKFPELANEEKAKTMINIALGKMNISEKAKALSMNRPPNCIGIYVAMVAGCSSLLVIYADDPNAVYYWGECLMGAAAFYVACAPIQ